MSQSENYGAHKNGATGTNKQHNNNVTQNTNKSQWNNDETAFGPKPFMVNIEEGTHDDTSDSVNYLKEIGSTAASVPRSHKVPEDTAASVPHSHRVPEDTVAIVINIPIDPEDTAFSVNKNPKEPEHIASSVPPSQRIPMNTGSTVISIHIHPEDMASSVLRSPGEPDNPAASVPNSPREPENPVASVPHSHQVSQDTAATVTNIPIDPEGTAATVNKIPNEPEDKAASFPNSHRLLEETVAIFTNIPIDPEGTASSLNKNPKELEDTAASVPQSHLIPEDTTATVTNIPIDPEDTASSVKKNPKEPEHIASSLPAIQRIPEDTGSAVTYIHIHTEDMACSVLKSLGEPDDPAVSVPHNHRVPEDTAASLPHSHRLPEDTVAIFTNIPIDPEGTASSLNKNPKEPEDTAASVPHSHRLPEVAAASFLHSHRVPEDTVAIVTNIPIDPENTVSSVNKNPKEPKHTASSVFRHDEPAASVPHSHRVPEDTAASVHNSPRVPEDTVDSVPHSHRVPEDTASSVPHNHRVPEDTAASVPNSHRAPEETAFSVPNSHRVPEDTCATINNIPIYPEDTTASVSKNCKEPKHTASSVPPSHRVPEDTDATVTYTHIYPKGTASSLNKNPKEPEDTASSVLRSPGEPDDKAASVPHSPRVPEDTAASIPNSSRVPEDTAASVINSHRDPEDTAASVLNSPRVPENMAVSVLNITVEPEGTAASVPYIPIDPEDTAGSVPNSPRVPEDTADSVPNSPRVPEDTAASIPNRSRVPEDTAASVLNSYRDPEDTASSVPHSHRVPEDTAASVPNSPRVPEDTAASVVNSHRDPEDTAASVPNSNRVPEDTAASVHNSPRLPEDTADSVPHSHRDPDDPAAFVPHSHRVPEDTAASVLNSHRVPENMAFSVPNITVEPEGTAASVPYIPIDPEDTTASVPHSSRVPEDTAASVPNSNRVPEDTAASVHNSPRLPEDTADSVPHSHRDPDDPAAFVPHSHRVPEDTAASVLNSHRVPENMAFSVPNITLKPKGTAASVPYIPIDREDTANSVLKSSTEPNDSHMNQNESVTLKRKPDAGLLTEDKWKNTQESVLPGSCTDSTRDPSPPEDVRVENVQSTSLTLCWNRPISMAGVSYRFIITYSCNEQQKCSVTKGSDCNRAVLTDLRPGAEYNISIATVVENGRQSRTISVSQCTKPYPLANLNLSSTDVSSVTLTWDKPTAMQDIPLSYRLTWRDSTGSVQSITTEENQADVSNLTPGTEYSFSVCTLLKNHNLSSDIVSISYITNLSPPEDVRVENVQCTSLTLCWNRPISMAGVSYRFIITYSCNEQEKCSVTKGSDCNRAVLTDLRPGAEYNISIAAINQKGRSSSIITTCHYTKSPLKELLDSLGMKYNLKENKLSLNSVLEINDQTESLTDEHLQCPGSLCWHFLRKLMMVNITARHTSITSNNTASKDVELNLDLNELCEENANSNGVNPLDLITALFLCSDGLLQQELALKMSMCQFAVPLLLPNYDTQQSTLMLWALRSIGKRFSVPSLEEPGGYVENSVVLLELPMVSFVRLGRSSFSKSHILNQVFSNPEQYHDTFLHYNMKNGNVPRNVSNGMVETSWYLPTENMNCNSFQEPVCVANLRGDISSHHTEFTFLCQISAAVFVFCDDLERSCEFLKHHDTKAQFILVCKPQQNTINKSHLQNQFNQLPFKVFCVTKVTHMNEAQFVDRLRSAVCRVMKGNCVKTSIEKSAAVAVQFGILVDEDYECCQKAKKKADDITADIRDIPQYKETELPLHGNTLKELAKLEKEECRLKGAAGKNIHTYKKELSMQKRQIRRKQLSHDVTPAISYFISGLSAPREERAYFLRWMQINLNTLSAKVSGLKELYQKSLEESKQNNQLTSELEDEISSNSLGLEHFFREIAQLYESAQTLPQHSASRQRMKLQSLPRLCAEMMLDGFPLELLDGDASHIPFIWVKAVLNELQCLTESNSKIRVITVLGVQSSGKSTLLNTMFGVQFAVSSGRCTRGAFMLLLRVKEEFKQQLGCGFIMVIDTEGLKSPELAQLADSYEYDNELATLVVGLSDITIMNIVMENCTEMQDILQIVVHAFLRMKEVGKKACCHFVHQNVADVSARDKILKEKKIQLNQLDKITKIAAGMEKKEENKCLTDIIEYNQERDNFYIPGLWKGTPPMAPVNAGYSDAVLQVKRRVTETLQDLKEKRPAHTIKEFCGLTVSLWQGVKYENFNFSFQNCLVAEAYSNLCEEYNKWDWDFCKSVLDWMIQAEAKVLNFNQITQRSQPGVNIRDFLKLLKSEAVQHLDTTEKKMAEELDKYFTWIEKNVYLAERYKEDFSNSIRSLRRQQENKVMDRLEGLVEMKKSQEKLEHIKENQIELMEKRVMELIEKCRESKLATSDNQIQSEFEKMWNSVMTELSNRGVKKQNVTEDIYNLLHENLKKQGGAALDTLLIDSNLEECVTKSFVVHKTSIFCGFFSKNHSKIQDKSDNIIEQCINIITDKVNQKPQKDYDSTYTSELLRNIDMYLDKNGDLRNDSELSTNLKIHICRIATREFNKMHSKYIHDNDPVVWLEKNKERYYRDFKELFHERDQSKTKAEEFTKQCLEPAVRDYITKSLGPDIVGIMYSSYTAKKFNNRLFFQYSVLSELFQNLKFESILQFIRNYNSFVKNWILTQIADVLSKEGCKTAELKNICLEDISMAIKTAIQSVQCTADQEVEPQTVPVFIDKICTQLSDKLVISKDAVGRVRVLNKAKTEEFSTCLTTFVEELKTSLRSELQNNEDIKTALDQLPFKPQEELFKRMFGCGEVCPFCNVPCEAGGEGHTEHFASMHRPGGLVAGKYETTDVLSTKICSTSVSSNAKFRNADTNWKFVPYKDYQRIYPNWRIQPDTNIQASHYWKYIFAQFNQQFAEAYKAKPAELPPEWLSITKEQALKNLEEMFTMTNQLSI